MLILGISIEIIKAIAALGAVCIACTLLSLAFAEWLIRKKRPRLAAAVMFLAGFWVGATAMTWVR